VKRAALFGVFMVLIPLMAGSLQAPECLYGPSVSPADQARRRGAVQVARTINTAQAAHRAKQGRFATLEELVAAAISLKGAPGFELKLTADAETYGFILKDTLDPCAFAFWSSESGLIYQGHPIR
jgi:hypothetical protein